MAQAPDTDESRERAVSSEPCSTRPNPFDDGDNISSRKRQRTSLSGASRSRSADTVNSSQGSIAVGDSAPEPRSDSAMKIDTDPTTPTTPEPQEPLSAQPPSGPRSSRVTINVRTPSRPLEVIPSSPPSPARKGASPAVATNQVDAIHISVEESEPDMSRDGTAVDTPTSESGSSPIEIISVEPENENELDGEDPEVMIIGGLLRPLIHDPSGDLPFFDGAESYPDTISRLLTFFPTHETVAKSLADWLETYVHFIRNAPYLVVLESYQIHRDIWHNLPDLVMLMVNRKAPYHRDLQVREGIFSFYRQFAAVTAYFVELDVKSLRSWLASDQPRSPSFASPFYVQAIAALTRKDEISLHSQQLHNGDDGWRYADEVTSILDAFQEFHQNPSGSTAHVKKLIEMDSQLVTRFPKLIDHLAYLSALTSNLLHLSYRRLQASGQQNVIRARSNIARGYNIFRYTSAALDVVIEKHVNHLSYDAASSLLVTLTEIYQICLNTDRVVAPEIIKQHRLSHPELVPRFEAEAIAYHWKFTMYSKLIMSSQMQLRVMAVTAMCNDLVTFYRKFNDPAEPCTQHFLGYVAQFLLQSGLVSYILGPTCHPEITAESGNIIGFLVVSGTYTDEHTDALWQTVTSTQDPRVSDALVRMTSRITNLFPYSALIYLCGKLNTVPVEAFSPTVREFCESIFRHIPQKLGFERVIQDSAPYDLCIRLMRESSTFGLQTPTAYPDIQQFATQKFKELLACGPTPQCRKQIYADCIDDIAQKSPFTIGSFWVLLSMIRQNAVRELRYLTSEHDLTSLLVDELEAAIPAARSAGFPTVLSGNHNQPRKDLISCILCHEPSTITKDLGPRLWHLLVGPGAASQEDRDGAWQILITAYKRNPGENPFTHTCFSEYLPTLEPECFCFGALDFLREVLIPLVDDVTSILLDDEESSDHDGLEQLWRMVLTAPSGSIEKHAIHTLVKDVYIDSRSIMSFSPYRAKKVHLALVGRCLRQLSSAAARLRGFSNGSLAVDNDSMEIVATEQQLQEQELLFTRSLSVLREFHRLHQAKGHFSAPDLRSLILDSPGDAEGESAELKYQAFDGDAQTDVAPLVIGKRNTAASLLASLRNATGFSNYRIYYKGRPFVPQESDMGRSLEQLRICNDIILVKRESEVPGSPTRTRAGASPVEVEILGHFEELRGYLCMEEHLAQEIYSFLVKLPADENIMRATVDPATPYLEIFPLGQPFKSLYAIYALKECLASHRRRSTISSLQKHMENPPVPYATILLRAMGLVVSAISDEAVIAQCSSQVWRVELSSSLIECFVSLLKDPFLPDSAAQFLDKHLLDRLLTLLTSALSTKAPASAPKHISLCLESILESCSLSETFTSAYCAEDKMFYLLEDLLLNDPRKEVRGAAALIILDKVGGNALVPSAVTERFQDFFWPLVSGMVRDAINHPKSSTEVLELCFSMLRILRDSRPQTLDMEQHINDWTELLLNYTTFEDVTQPDMIDTAVMNFTRLLHNVLCIAGPGMPREIRLPQRVARKIFWKHLFPPFEKDDERMCARPIIHPETRNMLIDIVLSLTEHDITQLGRLLHDLNDLVPLYPDDDELYAYELGHQFERTKAIRAPCGYVGLKNLSNTCYLNSLFTQLFMNVDFRQFMLHAEVKDRAYSQSLLFQTQKLFGFMQASIRRYMTPEDCVANIKTYEDTQIDIHSQMDVDEFYNLLFDRWEGQFLSGEEKQRFRAFYGGQLVQQVASKECDHISERLEPFSAIQCDIKGKSSLHESLQAYVDGEIMEGDNKYKCSTCDRHVDAVKRACLKDIPDNLIFHLKRFDFSVKSMLRSKINDYFSFPTKIDMRPYTIGHLSNPSQFEPEDIFELVGILVHSGTAESGHYYSYVRERPSRSETPVWVEFNDDVVSSWDPAMMENSCFGGPDYRSHFDNNSILYDKTYSAYMLFYQRSTSLAKQQELLQLSGRSSPFTVELPRPLGRHIEEENLTLLRRHCLYDPSQIQFVNCALQHLKNITGNSCSGDHRLENLGLTMALSHLDQVASRTKDIPDFFTLLRRLNDSCRSCVRCSLAVYQYCSQFTEVIRVMIQKNPDPDVRQAIAALILQVLQVIKDRVPIQYGIPLSDSGEESDEDEPDNHTTVIAGMMEIFRVLWDNFHITLRSWPEVFDFMLSFVKMGRHEMGEFLEHHFLRYLLLTLWADPSLEMPSQFVRMITAVTRRLATRPPSYEAIISLVDVLTSKMSFTYNQHGEVTGPEAPELRFERNDDIEQKYWFTKAEARLIHGDWARGQGNIFVDKLISINQNTEATCSIIANFVKGSEIMEEKVYTTLRAAITGQTTQHQNAPYLRIGSNVLCCFAKNSAIIAGFIAHVSQQCIGLQNSEGKAFLDFQRTVFDGPQEGSGDSPHDILMAGYDNIPMWTPGLLGYFEPAVVSQTEEFLHDVLFKFGPLPDLGDSEEARKQAEKIERTARALGIRCLQYLRDNYVSPGGEVPVRLVAGLERVIRECAKFFNRKDDAEDDDSREFRHLSINVLEPLRVITVEELEEEGSEWENSSGCSEQLESLEDVSLPMAGEL